MRNNPDCPTTISQGVDSYRMDNPSRHYEFMGYTGLLWWREDVRRHLRVGGLAYPLLGLHERINRRAYLQTRRSVIRGLP